MRKIIFENDYYYHIYNRGSDKREIFTDDFDFLRFLKSMKIFNRIQSIGSLYQMTYHPNCSESPFGLLEPISQNGEKDSGTNIHLEGSKCPKGHSEPDEGLSEPELEPLVEIICYCLNKNHYHFILRQKRDKGIEKFMHKLGMGYTNYFNHKYKRSGSLFQGAYKSINVNKLPYLFYLSAYINGNPEIHGYCSAEDCLWSSCLDYLGKRNDKIANFQFIVDEIGGHLKYLEYLKEVINESIGVKENMKAFLLEENDSRF